MKNYIFLVLLLTSTTVSSQKLIWSKVFGGTGDNKVTKSIMDDHNNLYIVGNFSGTIDANGTPYTTYGGSYLDAYVSKYDSDGNLIWFKQIGCANLDDYIDAITLSLDNNLLYIVGGYKGTSLTCGDGFTLANSDASGTYDAFLISINTSSGIVTGAKNIAYGPKHERPQDIKVDKDGNLVILGFSQGDTYPTYFNSTSSYINNGIQNYFIAQLNSSNLEINWVKHFTGNDGNNKLFSLDVDNNGYYIAGTNKNALNLDVKTLTSEAGSEDMFLYKTDFNGNGEWVRSIKGSAADYSVYVTCDQQGQIYISGYYASTDLKVDSTATLQSKRSVPNKGSNDIFFAKYKTNGNLVWFDVAGSAGDDRLTRLNTFNGYIVMAGQYSGPMTFGQQTITPKGGTDAFGVVHDANDNPLYAVTAGGSGTDLFQTCVIDKTGNYFFIGQGNSPTTYFSPTSYLTNPTPATRDVFIAKYNKASISIVKNNITCVGSNNGIANAFAKGAMVQPVSYKWSKKGNAAIISTTEAATSLSPGRYYVTATDAVNYTVVDSVDFADPTPLTVSKVSSFNVSCYGGNNGVIDIAVTGGSTPYTYAWTTDGGSGINAIVQDQTTLTKGSYSVQVSDKNGCIATLNNIVLTEPEKINFKGTTVTRINGAHGSVNLSVQGGTPAYAYAWVGPGYTASTEDISDLTAAGNYTVVVTDSKSCRNDTTVFVADSHVLNAYLGSKQNVLCKGESTGNITILTENVTGTPSYTWSPNVGNTATVTNLSAGNYSVTVSDGSSHSSIVNVTISEPEAALAISVSRANITCYNANNGVLDANPSGGTMPYVFNWTKEAQPYDGGDETQINLSEGTYAVTVTDANNCKASTSQVISNPALVSYTGTIKGVTCEDAKYDGSITLSNIQGGAGNYTFQWSNGLISQNATLLSANNYSVTVTDDNNCKVSNNYIVDYEAPMTITFNSTNVSCNGSGDGMLQPVITGGHEGFTYNWNTGATTASISDLLPGSYTVTVTDGKLCTKTATGNIIEPAVLSITSVNQANVSCYGVSNGSIALNVTGGTPQYNYSWDQGAGTSATASNLPAGTFNVTVTDANNCTTNGTYTITQPTALGLSEDVNAHVNPLCNGLSTGAITLLPAGGSGEYELSVNNGEWTSKTVYTDLAAGNYSFKLRDKNAITCEFALTQTVAITQPEAISIVSAISLNATQKSPWNGSINIVATGGSSPLSFTLDKGSIQQDNGSFADLGPDTYTISITDANNCAPVTSQVLTISDATSISMADGASLKIFPIPATDYIKIEYNNAQSNKPLHIVLYSISGKVVYEEMVAAEAFQSGAHQIDVTSMPKGMYILKVNDVAAKEKVIIQ
ncbi:MAG TPA: T9SS type A sorting domain-containing protein [Bacteroidales bacterium]|nr:T9SS type A sorting domain-containing protein [Bacteroidales bacterium]